MTLRGPAGAFACLIVAVLASAAIVYWGPPLAGMVLGQDVTAPAAETIFTLVIFAPLIAVAFVGGALFGVNAGAPGRYPFTMMAFGMMLGLAGVMSTIAYASIAGSLGEGAAPGASIAVLLWGAAVIAVQTGAEEVYFRGWLQPVLARAWGPAAAVGVTSIAFAGLHVLGGARSPVSLANLFLGGVMFGTLAVYGRGIAGAFAAHFAWNGAEQLVVGLDPNPGIGSFGAIIDLEMTGAGMWGGSDEGLNASIAMTGTLVVIVAALILFVRYRARDRTPTDRRLSMDG